MAVLLNTSLKFSIDSECQWFKIDGVYLHDTKNIKLSSEYCCIPSK